MKINGGRLTRIGGIGFVATALCCFTPLLVILFGAVGLVAVVGYLDYLLFPLLGLFLLLFIVGVTRRDRCATPYQSID